MIHTIWKYILKSSTMKVQMPKGAKVLYAGNQFQEICIWAEVNPDAEMAERHFEVYGTGRRIFCDTGASREYVGSVMLQGRAYVFHVYESTVREGERIAQTVSGPANKATCTCSVNDGWPCPRHNCTDV